MKLIHYQDPVKFQKDTREFLLQHEAENNLPIGVLSSVIAGEYLETTPYMGLVMDGETSLMVMMCTPPFPVLFAYHETLPAADTLRSVLVDLHKKIGDEFTGVTGSKTLSAKLVEIWEDISGEKARVAIAMRIYKLVKVDPPAGPPGRIRPASLGDRDLLLEWFACFNQEISGEKPDEDRVMKQVDRFLNSEKYQRGLMIWEYEGQPVSMAGYSGPTPNGIRIGAVFTPKDLRGNGYASACTAEMSQYLLDLGYKFCFLFTDLTNPISNHVYQKIGYRKVIDVDRYDFIRGSAQDLI